MQIRKWNFFLEKKMMSRVEDRCRAIKQGKEREKRKRKERNGA